MKAANVPQQEEQKSDIKVNRVWCPSTWWWKQFVPLTTIQNVSMPKSSKNGMNMSGTKISGQVGRRLIVIKNIPQHCCSAIDEKPA